MPLCCPGRAEPQSCGSCRVLVEPPAGRARWERALERPGRPLLGVMEEASLLSGTSSRPGALRQDLSQGPVSCQETFYVHTRPFPRGSSLWSPRSAYKEGLLWHPPSPQAPPPWAGPGWRVAGF